MGGRRETAQKTVEEILNFFINPSMGTLKVRAVER
jgi:hypothetical protein